MCAQHFYFLPLRDMSTPSPMPALSGGILRSPLPGFSVVLFTIVHVFLCDILNQRIVCVVCEAMG